MQADGVSQRRACQLVDCTRSTLHYRRQRPDEEPIAARMRELAAERPRWGWRRLLILIRRDKIDVGERRFRRIYRELGLKVRPRRKQHVRYLRGNAIAPVHAPNERWSLDFMHDTLAGGRKIRTLMVIDDFTRECLAIAVSTSFSSKAVIRVLEAIEFDNG
ncbi:MAG TPA: DDE-type integrase/transposase/recombinase, partial [Candidatus Baltobacteraceae bacterium]|nr:DDE-type integrase/transposase/recombinase [Candidatus Baltobacteraceae bacterium]